MKRLISIILFIGQIFLVQAQEIQISQGAIITWQESKFDFGDIYQGDKLSHTFKFTNTGNLPLVITNVEVTCGCTTPKGWARDPIPPGNEGEITVSFDSSAKFGKQNKVIKVTSNSVGTTNQVMISANVLEKQQPD